MIKKGDLIPSVPVKLVNNSGVTDADSTVVLSAGKVVLFTLPGAFTPTCHANHLPGYVANAPEIRAKGVNRIVCATVNDEFVVKAWANDQNALGAVEFIADGNGELARVLGLAVDRTASVMGNRFTRTALVIDDGIVGAVFTEDKNGQVTSSGARAILAALETETA